MKKTPETRPEVAPRPGTDRLDDRRRLVLLRGAALVGAGMSALAGCGGGGDAAAGATAAANGVPDARTLGIDSGGTGVVPMFFSAVVSAVAPLVAAGIRFDTNGCTVVDGDGRALPLASLAPGMTGRIDAASAPPSADGAQVRARTVRVVEELLGAVTAVDTAGARLAILGQAVQITPQTVFETGLPGADAASALAAIAPGQILRVWGQNEPDRGRVVASRIGSAAPEAAWVVRGQLVALDRANARIVVGGLDLQGANPADGPAGWRVGQLVRARLQPNTNLLLGVSADPIQVPDGVVAEIEGRVTRVDGATRFAVDGMPVDAGGPGVALRGAALAVGAKASVHGRATLGTLYATEVALEAAEPDPPDEIEGTIGSVDAAANRFVLRGLQVRWTVTTRFVRGTARQLRAGRQVHVTGLKSVDGGALQAQTISIED